MISKMFYVWLFVAAGMLLVAMFLLQQPLDLPVALYFSVVGFGVLTFLLYRNILKANEKSPRRFVTAFMGSVSIKLLLTALVVGILIYFDKAHKAQLAVGMMVIYVAYTVVLVRSLTHKLTDNTGV
jgi:predicted Kef-type K+ transport protein